MSSRDAETGHVSRRVAGVILPAGGRSSSVLIEQWTLFSPRSTGSRVPAPPDTTPFLRVTRQNNKPLLLAAARAANESMNFCNHGEGLGPD